MCGISGEISALKSSIDRVEIINERQHHRGPDHQDVYVSDDHKVVLGMTRLSIIDLDNGYQPMSIDNGNFTIVFNGEIFNAAKLRHDLMSKFNESFSTNSSDTEVLVRMYKNYGLNCFEKLNGMFAAVIYDKLKNICVILRDEFGIKPLFYHHNLKTLTFSSEIRSLKAVHEGCINHRAISDYLDFGYISGDHTIDNSIQRFPRNSVGVFSLANGQLEIKPMEQMPNTYLDCKISVTKAKDQIRSCLIEAVKNWTISDQSLCFSLSGGVDSASLVSIASQMGTVDTFSVGFDQGFGRWNELEDAREISKTLGTNHNEIIINMKDVEQDLFEMLDIIGEPYSGGLPSYYLYKEASKNYRVILTGLGGDELFGNYSSAHKYKNYYGTKKPFDVRSYINLKYLCAERNDDNKLLILKSEDLNKKIVDSNDLGKIYSDHNFDENICNFDLSTQLVNEFLSMTDSFSMNFSLEARTPFLDKNFSKYIVSLPMKMRNTPEKYKSLLTDSLNGILPKSTLNKPKKGFSLPLSILMRENYCKLFETLLSNSAIKNNEYINTNIYETLIHPFLNGDNRFVSIVWRLFILQIWLNRKTL